MTCPLLIIGPPPTPNGDLHIGHIAGPYMSADVLRRWARMNGREALFVTGTDDSQTYVVGSAAKRGMTPAALAEQSTAAIRVSLAAAEIEVDGFAPFDAGYEATVRAFLDPLHRAGRFRTVRRSLPWDAEARRFLVEGLIGGECPHCLAASRGGLCEACGQPVACEDLRHPVSTLDGSTRIERREVEILVLPLEDYRSEIQAYYSTERLMALRPGARRIIETALSQPLPDFPITYPLDWGIPARYSEVPGQVFNAWAEGMAASIYCTAAASDGRPETGMRAWQNKDTSLVYFLGLDNVYFWGITHLSMLLAHRGQYILPQNYYSNHFYELDDEKISTSRGHVVLMGDLLQTYSASAVRFYLCWTSPELTERSFSHASLEGVARRQLIDPWNAIRSATDAVTVTMADRQLVAGNVARMAAEMSEHMSLEAFSTAGAARCLAKHLARLASYAAGGRPRGTLAAEFQALARLADPILKLGKIDVAVEEWRPSFLALTSPSVQRRRVA